MTTSYCRHSPSLSRTENVLHAFLHSNIEESTFHHLRWSPSLSREGNVSHAFLRYIDRLEVCGWWTDKERFYKRSICNILLLSLIPTKRNLLSTSHRLVPLSLQRGKYVISFYFPLFKQSGINYPPTSSVPLSFKKGASFFMLSFS